MCAHVVDARAWRYTSRACNAMGGSFELAGTATVEANELCKDGGYAVWLVGHAEGGSQAPGRGGDQEHRSLQAAFCGLVACISFLLNDIRDCDSSSCMCLNFGLWLSLDLNCVCG